MVRAGHLKQLALLFLIGVTSASGARAEDPLDWYAAMRRVAKYSSIASRGGASEINIRPYADEAAQLGPRIDSWSKPPGSDQAKATCLFALRNLQFALKIPRASDRYEAISDGEALRDNCQRSIWGQ